jgi:hypothetical protein
MGGGTKTPTLSLILNCFSVLFYQSLVSTTQRNLARCSLRPSALSLLLLFARFWN